MKKLILALALFSQTSMCLAEQVQFHEIALKSCLFIPPGTQASNQLITSQSDYDDFIFKFLHEYLTEFLVQWAKNEKRQVPEVPHDYKNQLRSLRASKPGLREAEYVHLISSELARPLVNGVPSPVSHLSPCSFPAVDFSSENLILMSTLSGGCRSPNIKYEVVADHEKKEIRVTLVLQQIGMCKAGHWISSLLKVPASPKGYKVAFETNELPALNEN